VARAVEVRANAGQNQATKRSTAGYGTNRGEVHVLRPQNMVHGSPCRQALSNRGARNACHPETSNVLTAKWDAGVAYVAWKMGDACNGICLLSAVLSCSCLYVLVGHGRRGRRYAASRATSVVGVEGEWRGRWWW